MSLSPRAVLLSLFIAAAPLPTLAGPREDARFIVENALTKDTLAGAINAQRGVLTSAISHDLKQRGIEISDMNRFMDIFMEEFLDGFHEAMLDDTTALYLDVFTADELSAIAAFHRSEAGQTLLAKTPMLMKKGAQLGAKHGATAGRSAGPRVARRLEAEGISITKDGTNLQKLLDALRQ